MYGFDATDSALYTLLRKDARQSVSELARILGVSRSTVQDRIARLEDRGFIRGYTIREGRDIAGRAVQALVTLKVKPKAQEEVIAYCRGQENVIALYTIAGEFDIAAVLRADTTAALDKALDAIALQGGVERTQTSVVLSTKFERG